MKMQARSRALDKIYKRRNRYEIPDWQRSRVWNVEKKQKLIDTILRGWGLPKFYLNKIGLDQFEVVDGQQRLTAIFEFFGNTLSLSEDSAEKFGGVYYKDLPEDISDTFDDYEIDYDEIEEATEEELKEFFQRLQLGLPLTASEKLNSVHSKLVDFCRELSEHNFFRNKISVPDTRHAHFDIVSKVAGIEIEGLSTGLRFNDLRRIFESHNNFSTSSTAAKNLIATFDFLDRAFADKSPLLKNRTIVQSFSTLVARIMRTGKSAGFEEKVREFFDEFMAELNRQVELGQSATDQDYLEFQQSISSNLKGAAKTRQEILLRKLLVRGPEIAALFDPVVIQESGVNKRIAELGESIVSLISQINSAYSAKNGKDLFKATNKTATAQSKIGKPIKDYNGYKSFIDELYFLFHESVGTRLDDEKLQSFSDVNSLRTDLQHDIDHGKASKVKGKRKQLSEAFSRYAGAFSPQVYPQEKFAAVQGSVLAALESDLRNLKGSV